MRFRPGGLARVEECLDPSDHLQSLGPPIWLLVVGAFAMGSLVGSFLNVVIARVPVGESIVWPPSHCRSCGKGILPLHNVPVLSWFWLRGRCQTCLARFSVRYALVEAAFGVVCAFAIARHGLSFPAAREIVMMGFLISLSAMDLDRWVLPLVMTASGAVVGLVLTAAEGLSTGEGWGPAMRNLFASAIGYTALAGFGWLGEKVFKKEAIGGGDPWLVALIAAFLGMRALLPVMLLSSLQGSVIGALMILSRRRRERGLAADAVAEVPKVPEPAPPDGTASQPKNDDEDEDDWQPDPTAIPFGPFLALAAAEILYFSRLPDVLFPIPF